MPKMSKNSKKKKKKKKKSKRERDRKKRIVADDGNPSRNVASLCVDTNLAQGGPGGPESAVSPESPGYFSDGNAPPAEGDNKRKAPNDGASRDRKKAKIMAQSSPPAHASSWETPVVLISHISGNGLKVNVRITYAELPAYRLACLAFGEAVVAQVCEALLRDGKTTTVAAVTRALLEIDEGRSLPPHKLADIEKVIDSVLMDCEKPTRRDIYLYMCHFSGSDPRVDDPPSYESSMVFFPCWGEEKAYVVGAISVDGGAMSHHIIPKACPPGVLGLLLQLLGLQAFFWLVEHGISVCLGPVSQAYLDDIYEPPIGDTAAMRSTIAEMVAGITSVMQGDGPLKAFLEGCGWPAKATLFEDRAISEAEMVEIETWVQGCRDALQGYDPDSLRITVFHKEVRGADVAA